MSLVKRLTRGARVRRALCRLGAWYITLVHATGRWRVVGGAAPARLWAEKTPFILCFWHGRLLMMPYCWDRAVPIHLLVSAHRDGQLIGDTVRPFGFHIVTGSSSKGGGGALRTLVKAIRGGGSVGLTPDGPRGPRMRAGPGVAVTAKLSGAPIVPIAYSAAPRRVLATWDRFILPLPFGRGVFVWGEPITVARDADDAALEAARRQVEDSLNALTRGADRLCGQAEIAPDQEAAGAEATVRDADAVGEGA